MLYADFKYYSNDYRGTMKQADFDRLAVQASAYLDEQTFGRIEGKWTDDARIKAACCAVVDALLLNEQGGGIASESNDGYSVNYLAGVSKAKTDAQRLRDAARRHLIGTGLLYRGCM